MRYSTSIIELEKLRLMKEDTEPALSVSSQTPASPIDAEKEKRESSDRMNDSAPETKLPFNDFLLAVSEGKITAKELENLLVQKREEAAANRPKTSTPETETEREKDELIARIKDPENRLHFADFLLSICEGKIDENDIESRLF